MAGGTAALASSLGSTRSDRYRCMPVPAGISLPMITFSLRPTRESDLAWIAASVSTRVVSWKDAADSHDSVASDAFVIPMSTGDHGEHVTGGEDEVLLVRVLHLGAAVLAVQDGVADLDVHRDALGPGVVEPARPDGDDLALLWLLLRGVRDDQPGRRGLLGVERADHDPVFERLDNNLGGGRHDLTSPCVKG